MSRQNMNQSMQNGIPPQWCGTQLLQKNPNFSPQPLNNGLGSSQSSRDSSPMARLPPPSKANIPASQLPPGRSGVSPIQHNGPTVTSASVTPHSSPRIGPLSTSTPVNNKIDGSSAGDSVQLVNKVASSNQSTNHPPLITQSIQQPAFIPTSTQQSITSGQQTSSEQTSLTSSISQMPPVKHGLNQAQTIQRPVNSGPQLQQTFESNLQNQSHFLQSQSQTYPVSQQQQQFPQLQTQVLNSTGSVSPVNQQSNLQHQKQFSLSQPQLQNPSQFNQQQRLLQPLVNNQGFNSSVMPPVPPNQRPADNRLPTENVNYPQMSPVSHSVASNSAVTPVVSSLHSKRYPQPTQNQNFPASTAYNQGVIYSSQSQQNINLPPTSVYNSQQQHQQQSYNNHQQQQQVYNNQQQTNSYYQQQPDMYNQQQQQQYQQQLNQQRNYQNLPQQMQNMNIVKSGFNKLWGQENYDLLQCPNVLPEEQILPPKVSLGQEFLDAANCSPEIFRCTMTKIPESNSLLQKSRLPLGVLIHPFKDLNHLPVISCNTIVRCRACRTYINPFIFFVDTKRWKCNLCYRVNELPEEFQYDPVSKTYGDPSRRPEIKSSTIEYIAPSEYMLRPPQPAVYLFLLDVSRLAVESGYLHTMCEVLSSQLSTLPGDARTQIGFLAYNSTLHFFSLAEGLSQPHEMIVTDIDDIFLPCPDNLLVNLKEHTELVSDLLAQLPTRYQHSYDNGSALGAALQAAFKLMSATGGRVTVFQASLPQLGPGALTVREDPNQRAGKEAPHLNPATDFYKRLALDCSGHQIAVDLFLINSQYVDIATLSGVSRFSGGCMYHFPLFKAARVSQSESLERCFRRYLCRKIGFEAVMRIRCTRGLSIHTFHGNFFVRSTDLLTLPNINPDAGFGMQISIEESLTDLQSVCLQAALLYTSSKGERRIRVHTLCLPIVSTLPEVLNAADQQCIVGLLAKMAVDRSLQSSLSDARDAFINVAIDILSSYKLSLNVGTSSSGLLAPSSLKLLPLYILALLKSTAFRTGQSTRLDDRVFAMCDMKTLPLPQLIQTVYPDLYPIYRLPEYQGDVEPEGSYPLRRLQLTARNIDSHGAYLLDAGQEMIIFVCPNVSQSFLIHTLGVSNYNAIPDQCFELQKLDNDDNKRLHAFINRLNDEKPYSASLQILRENSPNRNLLLERLIEDRIEFALSYNEFLQHLKTQVK